MSDPNWFYSALAQSAAAIVGLIGALLLLKITETSNTIRNVKAELRNEKKALRKKSYPLIDKIDELERKLRQILVEIGTKTAGTEGYTLSGNYGSIVVEKGETDIEKIKKGLKLTSSSLEKWKYSIKNFDKNVEELSEIISSLVEIKETANLISNDFGERLEKQLLKENEWNEDFLSFKNKLDDCKDLTIPKSYYLILIFLAFIVIVGVIIPLGYLSAFSGYSKIVLISLFSVGIIGLILYFIYQVHEIRSIK